MFEPTPITLPQSVPFPVTVNAILCREGDTVSKHSTVLRYKYWEYEDDPNSKADVPPKIRVERIGSFELPLDGKVNTIDVRVDDEIAHSNVVLYSVIEACTHTVQYGGLCALCGMAVDDEKDYTGYDYKDRATIEMSHDNTGLKISMDEAAKIEHGTTARLTTEKKLILVVDLDQTVIHATVDPTVGEWQLDPANPNYPAVKDVKTFSLEEEPIVPPGWTGPRLMPTKCTYYVKVRPGLLDFLLEISTKYELHIYTMATRNYALAIAKIIDPTGKYFGDRILSRDESGSLTHKNLKRLFPVDQSMVVIIDDRGDVWQWESNLIKVVPYDFFVGIGDINSSFLPKKNGQLTGPTKKRKSIARLKAQQDEKEGTFTESDPEEKVGVDQSPVDRILELGGGEGNTDLLMEQSITRNQSIEQQQHDRPLAKLQHNLEQMHHHGGDGSSSPSSEENNDDESDDDEDDNLLYDDDNELISLNKVLLNIHSEYYKVLKQSQRKPNLTTIIPQMKSQCLQGITILFSGIIPIGLNIETADIVIWCKQFGVRVVNEVYPGVTHVVCRDPANGGGPTFKARVAKRILPGVKIVNPDWLFACLSTWSKVDETEYVIGDDVVDGWEVNVKDITKYQKALERQAEKVAETVRPRFDSVESIEQYDLDEANQEVDEFLADISDDDDEGGDDGEDEDEEAPQPAGDSFIKDMYRSTKKRPMEIDDESESDADGDNDVGHDNENAPPHREQPLRVNGTKKQKVGATPDVAAAAVAAATAAPGEVDLDELEQELLDGFDDLED